MNNTLNAGPHRVLRNLGCIVEAGIPAFLCSLLLLGWIWAFRTENSLNDLTHGVIALVLFATFANPYRNLATKGEVSHCGLVTGAGIFVAGIISDVMLLSNIGWTIGCWAWLKPQIRADQQANARRVLPMSLLVFPWIQYDLGFLSLGLRNSAATITHLLADFLQFEEPVYETVLVIRNQMVLITGNCDGRDSLQAILIIGLGAAHCFIGPSKLAWIWVPVFAVMGWLVNVLRIAVLFLAGTTMDLSRYGERIHDVSGNAIVFIALAVCVVALQRMGTSEAISIHGENVSEANSSETVASRMTSFQLLGSCWLILLIVFLLIRPRHSIEEGMQRAARVMESIPHTTIPVSEEDRMLLGDATAERSLLSIAGRLYTLTIVDGTNDRHAVHDPSYCWNVLSSAKVRLSRGHAKAVNAIDAGKARKLLYWYSDGRVQHASHLRYFIQTCFRRLTLGWCGSEPVLVVVESQDNMRAHWHRAVDRMPLLKEL